MPDLHLVTPRFRLKDSEFVIHPRSLYLTLLSNIGNLYDDQLFQFLETQFLQFEIVSCVIDTHEPY